MDNLENIVCVILGLWSTSSLCPVVPLTDFVEIVKHCQV